LRARAHSQLPVAGLNLASLPTVTPAQWRLNWSKGCVKRPALAAALRQMQGAQGLQLVACHHPLVDADTHGSGSTRGGRRALAALAAAGVDAVLSGHVHDPFDLTVATENGPIRIIGAGTLSERLRASEPCYNRLEWQGEALELMVKTKA
jgi:3',5'-cyclic AMP phosphodiesterase CpdA